MDTGGFTLAELLIVVAIIAVLVAIAIPIFVGQLDDAKKARDNANIRSVRAAAINAILTSDDLLDADTTSWDAYAKVYANGDIKDLDVQKDETPTDNLDSAVTGGDSSFEAGLTGCVAGELKDTNGYFEIYVEVTETQLAS